MKKVVAIAVAALLAVPLVGGAAQAGKKKAPVQSVEGTIAFPAPFAQGTFDGCWGGLTRRTSGQTGGAVNGVTGYYFDIDPKSWNKPFKLEVTGGQGTVDLDLFMYIHYPPPEETQADPVNGGTPSSVDFQTREAGGEAGKVPPETTKAIVCMYAGPEHQGFDAAFTYTAG